MWGPQSRRGGLMCLDDVSGGQGSQSHRTAKGKGHSSLGYHEYKALVDQQPAHVGCSFTGYTKQARAK